MSIHEKILELTSLGFDIKFDRVSHSFDKKPNIFLALRYHGNGSTKIENREIITMESFSNEGFVVSILDKIYKEMSKHSFSDREYFIPENGE